MSSSTVYYFATFAVLVWYETIFQVIGQCTIKGCENGDPMFNTIADIEQLNFEAFRQLSEHVQSIRQIFSESINEMKNLQAFERCHEKNDVYVRQVQSILELLDASSQELKTLQTVERLPKEKDIYLRQVQNIHELLNASLHELRSLQTIDRRSLENDIYLKQVQNIHQLLNASIQEMRSLQIVDRCPSGNDKSIKHIQSVEVKNENDTFSTGLHVHNISTTSQTQIPWIVINEAAAATHLGCYDEFGTDEVFERATKVRITELRSLAPDGCRERCRENLIYSYAALWNGTYCYCTAALTKGQVAPINDSLCNITCPGDEVEFCGGPGDSYYFSVYSVCPRGLHGRNCTKRCNCKDNESCTVFGLCADECASGWKMNTTDPNRKRCSEDVDECQIKCKSANSTNCHNCNSALRRKCNNVIGSFTCICEDGFEEINNHCADIDECVRVRHECNHNCTNTEGSYNCYCRSGYELHGNFSCRDVDECQIKCKSANSTNCHNCNSALRRKCNNVIGSYTCICEDGFEEINNHCADIDECVRVRHECNHNCTNTEGSYNCYCRSGYELHGNFSCRDIDECATSHQCEHYCSNIDGSYSCHCQSGYELHNRFYCRRNK